MSRFIRLDTQLTDQTAPKVPLLDAIETDGSVFLWDAATAALATVPAGGATISNQLAALGLATTGVTADFVVSTSSTMPTASVFTELTAKGGLHVLPSQVNQTGTEQGYAIRSRTALTQWLNDNPAKNLFVSVWRRVTRNKLAGNGSTFHQAVNTGNYRWHMQNGEHIRPAPSGSYRSSPASGDIATGILGTPEIRNALVPGGSTGTGVTSTSYPVTVGSGSLGAWAGTALNTSPGIIIYRIYIEDLDASGRSYADVDAIDYELFQSAFAAGGKFYGDTWTDPATFP